MRKIILLVLILVSIAVEFPLAFGLWRVTAFLEPELIHDKLMSLGDTREMTDLERWKIKLIWIPFAIVTVGFTFAQILMVKALLFRASQNPNQTEAGNTSD